MRLFMYLHRKFSLICIYSIYVVFFTLFFVVTCCSLVVFVLSLYYRYFAFKPILVKRHYIESLLETISLSHKDRIRCAYTFTLPRHNLWD